MSAFPAHGAGPLERLIALLSRSFPLGRTFGVEVRMYLVAALLMPLLFLHWFQGIAATGLERMTLSAFAFVGLYALVWSHEMGHIAMARRHGLPVRGITLSPLGGLAHLGWGAPTPRKDLDVALGGPAVHVLWLAVLWPLRRFAPYDLVVVDGWATLPFGYCVELLFDFNLVLLLFNLLPLFPLDGGRALRAALAMRMDAGRATYYATGLGLVGAVVMGLYGASADGARGVMFLCLAFANLEACLRERADARVRPVYGGVHRRAGLDSDADAWRQGAPPFGEPDDVAVRRPGPVARWRARREAARATREAQQQVDLERDVDRVLARLHEVGMHGLSDEERAVLRRASERRRGPR